jgi:hypothetical protein
MTRRWTVVLVLASLARFAAPLGAQTGQSPVGTWRGTSLCLVRPSSCNDEIVVYRIAPANANDSLTMDARKIVKGREEEMGVLGCHFARAGAQVVCGMRNGEWRFDLHGDSLTGVLRLPNGTKFRDVRTARSR